MRTSLMLFALAACTGAPPAPSPTPPPEVPAAATPDAAVVAAFKALPANMADDAHPVSAERVTLGRVLYHDPRLSKNHDVSCNSCHQLDKWGVDNEATSPGHKGVRGGRNSPTVYNAGLHLAQFWDGRAADLEAQAKGPILNPVEMAMPDEASVITVLTSIPGYAEPFKAAFPGEADPITYDNMARAIGAFERTLVTPGKLDAYLGGDTTALTEAEVVGAKRFVQTGCVTCHTGPAIGGTMYQKMGLVEPYPTQDAGRMEVTGKETDKHVFKVPSLRNIAKTGPYLHDGSVADLSEAVRLMGKHQLGKELTDAEVAEIVTFLGALTADVPAEISAAPTLPESGPNTPAADPS